LLKQGVLPWFSDFRNIASFPKYIFHPSEPLFPFFLEAIWTEIVETPSFFSSPLQESAFSSRLPWISVWPDSPFPQRQETPLPRKSGRCPFDDASQYSSGGSGLSFFILLPCPGLQSLERARIRTCPQQARLFLLVPPIFNATRITSCTTSFFPARLGRNRFEGWQTPHPPPSPFPVAEPFM